MEGEGREGVQLGIHREMIEVEDSKGKEKEEG